VLESFASKTRDKAAALTFMNKIMKRHGRVNTSNQDRHLISRETYKAQRSAAFAEWKTLAA
jgi:hypothetical protein